MHDSTANHGNRQGAGRGQMSRRSLLRQAAVRGLSSSAAVAAVLGHAGPASATSLDVGFGPRRARTQGSPVPGGTLATAIEDDPITLDPAYTASLPGRRVGRAVFDPLVDLNEQGELVPMLAESWEQPDDRSYVLNLRQGVSFHDGTPFDAEAVKFHFDRHLDEANESLRRGELLAVESVEILDPHAVRVNLHEPFAPFLYALFDWSGFVVSPTAVESLGDEFGVQPVGTGPFKFVEYIRDERTVVTRNENYWDPSRPQLDEIIFRPIQSDTSRLTELRSGAVQIAEDMPYQDIARMRSMPEIVLSEKTGFRFEFLAFQTAREPLAASKPFRQALNWLIDREAIHQSVYFGTGAIGYDPFLPGTAFYDPDYVPFTRDLDRARELLDEAGAASASFTVYVGADPVVQKKAQIIQANFAEAGVTMNIQNEDPSSNTTRLVDGDFELFIGRWWGYRPDPDQYLSTLLHSAGSNNYSSYGNPEVDRLIEEARATPAQEERVALYRQISPLVNDDAPNIYYHTGSNFKGLAPSVGGFVHRQDSIVRYADIWLAS
jgi:peptide/nickel transport system substrate-binding protein